jgi:FkbM family methyltransferase
MLVASVGARLNKTFIDIGAHTGMYSLMAAKINKNLVIMSFEPNFLAFSRLIMHVKINNIKNIQLLNFAVSNTKNNLNLNWSNPKGFGWISSGGHVSDHDVVHTYNSIVRCLTLDSLIIENPAFIKIDVEGHELNVIEGAINTIQKSFPDILIESFNEDNCKKVSKLLGPKYHFFKILEKEKYLQKTYEIQPASVESGNFNYFCTIHPESYLKELSQFKIKLI